MLEVRVPQLGEGLREVRIVHVLRKPGDVVQRGDPCMSSKQIRRPSKWNHLRAAVSIGGWWTWMMLFQSEPPIVVLADDPDEVGDGSCTVGASRLIPPRTRAYAKTKGIEDQSWKKLLLSRISFFLPMSMPISLNLARFSRRELTTLSVKFRQTIGRSFIDCDAARQPQYLAQSR